MKQFTHASLFSGIGGPEVAAAMLGWHNAFHCEINPFGRAVLEYWFPDSISYADITKTQFNEWRGKIDVLTGGFPCQPFSYAGKRAGANDDRYLWPQMLRVIDEIRPTWVVGENVAGIATMVEGGVLSDLGGEGTLFTEDNDIHLYELEETYTIERICKDLEQVGYSVQPILIPAASVGAPHRRDRIFIIAHDADTDSRDDVRIAGEDEGEGGEERLQERDEVREFGKSSDVRSEGARAVTDSLCIGCQREREPEVFRRGNTISGDRTKSQTQGLITNTDCKGREKPVKSGRGKNRQEEEAGVHDRAERPCDNGVASKSYGERFQTAIQRGSDGQKERNGKGRYAFITSDNAWTKETRWLHFPSFSPVHRGNDGLPFSLDDLTISPVKWRTESLKAYGNAIVPQVMYEIFRAIELTERKEDKK